MNNKTIFLAALALLVSFAAHAKQPPKWTKKVNWEEGGYHYFVGTSSGSSSEELGRREAYDNAMGEALQSLFGVTGRMELASYADLQKIQISQDVYIATDEVQLPAQSVDIFVEKVKEKGVVKFNVWRSIKIKKSDAEGELARLKRLAEEKKIAAVPAVSDEKDGLVAVIAEGSSVIVNENKPAAKAAAVKNAIKRSCERLSKEWYYSDFIQQNFDKFSSVVFNRCASYSKGYDLISGEAVDNVYKANLKVYLKGAEIERRLKDVGLYRQKNGRNHEE